MPEIRLAYRSRRAPWLTDTALIDQIVLPSMAKNRRLGVTGCLWFNQSRFLQALEGEVAPVDALYQRIVADKRHLDVELLEREPIESRRFRRWSMKLVPAERPDPIEALLEDPNLARVGPPARSAVAEARPVERLLARLVARTG